MKSSRTLGIVFGSLFAIFYPSMIISFKTSLISNIIGALMFAAISSLLFKINRPQNFLITLILYCSVGSYIVFSFLSVIITFNFKYIDSFLQIFILIIISLVISLIYIFAIKLRYRPLSNLNCSLILLLVFLSLIGNGLMINRLIDIVEPTSVETEVVSIKTYKNKNDKPYYKITYKGTDGRIMTRETQNLSLRPHIHYHTGIFHISWYDI